MIEASDVGRGLPRYVERDFANWCRVRRRGAGVSFARRVVEVVLPVEHVAIGGAVAITEARLEEQLCDAAVDGGTVRARRPAG